MPAMTVSMALIVRDEERVLARCLESLRGAVDEIVVVDTGSTDRTKAIARRYTDRLFDFAWCDDFAAARQCAFDRAGGDWVVWVDADDVVHNAERIRPVLAATEGDIGGLRWPYIYDHDEDGSPSWRLWQRRCVRNDDSYRWVGRIHERLITDRPWVDMRVPEIVVEHFRERERIPEKLRRNLALLEVELAASNGAPSAHLLLHMGRDLAGAGQVRRAIPHIRRALHLIVEPDDVYLTYLYLARLYQQVRRYDRAIEAYLASLGVHPEWPDAYFGLAAVYYHLRDWPKVVHWTQLGRAMPEPETDVLYAPRTYQYDWIIYYTNALFHLGLLEEALEWTRRALAICPHDPQHRHNEAIIVDALAGKA